MKKCLECGKEVDESFKFCPYCFADFAEEDNSHQSDVSEPIESSTRTDEAEEKKSAETDEVLFADRYILEEPLSCSEFGTVCLVKHYKNDRLYILKDFRIVGKTKPEREKIGKNLEYIANALKTLKHINLSSVMDSKYENDTFSVIYEYQTGCSLDEYLEDLKLKSGYISEKTALTWARDIAELLYFFQKEQKRPFCCCNILPYSFLVNDEEKIKYINIGMPVFYKETGIKNPFENEILDNSKISPEYDLFCFGLTLLYIISGKNLTPSSINIPTEVPKNVRFPSLRQVTQKLLNEYSRHNDIQDILQDIKNIIATYEKAPELPEQEKAEFNWNIYLGSVKRLNSFGTAPSPFLYLSWSIMVKSASRFYLQPSGKGLTVLSDKGELYLISFTKAHIIKKYSLNINAVPPVINNDIMYINSSSGQTAIDFEKNEPLWDFRTKSMFLTPPSITKDAILTLSYDGFMVKVNPTDGKPISMENIKGKVMAPIIYDQARLYIPTLSHGLLAVNRESRIVEWELPSSSFTSGAALSKDGRLYAGDGMGTIFCVDASTGKEIWSSSMKGAVIHGPAISENKIICSTSAGQISAFNKDSGEKLWTIDYGAKSNPVFCISGTFMFMTSPEHTILTANIENGTVYRQIKLKGKANSIPLAVNGMLYCTSDEGEIYAFSSRD